MNNPIRTRHAAVAGADSAALHRIEKPTVRESARAAGLEIAGESDILGVGSDDHSQRVFAEGVRGKTNRFVVKLRKLAS